MAATNATSEFTATSAFAIAGDFGAVVFVYVGFVKMLPKTTSRTDKITRSTRWFHFVYEGSWLYLSTFGRTVNGSKGPLAGMLRDHAAVNFRWGTADLTVVSLEILMVIVAGPLCCYTISQLIRNDCARHFWIIVLSTAELYGGRMTFCPEWLAGSPNLDTSNVWGFGVYVVFMNGIRVLVPLWLMWDSYHTVAGSLRSTHKAESA